MTAKPQTALVTGANSGIGLALTHKLLAEGYHVIATTRSGALPGIRHEQLAVVALDLTDEASIGRAVARIGQFGDGLDVLVNNAGVAPDVMQTVPDRAAFASTFATNVDGTVFFTEPLLPLLHDGAHVLFVSSSMGLPHQAAPNGPAYRLSKAAINMYAAMLAGRLAARHIRVTPLHPGWVQTRLGGPGAPATPGQAAAGIFEAIAAQPETGRFWNVETHGLVAY